MIIRTVFVLSFLMAGCTIFQVTTDHERSSNGTGDIMGIVSDEYLFSINPPFHLVLFNQNKRFVKLVSELSFSFDSIPTGSYTLALIDSVKSEGRVYTDTLYNISIETDSISMVAMYFMNYEDDYQWQPVKIHRRDRNNTGSIEGRFNVEEYEKLTGCEFVTIEGGRDRPLDNGKYAAIYIKAIKANNFESKTYTDSLGNFKFDNVPNGYYEVIAEKQSKKEICSTSSTEVVSDYLIHRSYKIIQLLVLPNKTSVVKINKINPWDILLTFIFGELESEIFIEWPPQFKN